MKIRTIIYLSLCFILLSSCKQSKEISEQPQEFILGYVYNIQSEILQENRTINIYLPDGYDKDTKYPVIYLLDGSADEDFIHVVGIVQYNAFPWVERVPKSIVVGIANTNRRKDFTSVSTDKNDLKLIPDNGGSEKFISFIERELQPYIENKYKTSDSKTIIGQSLGGLLATEILFTKPQLFDKYIIISPSLWWRNGYLLQENPAILNGDNAAPISVYIGVGTEGSIDESSRAMEDDAKLLADKIKRGDNKSLDVYFDHLADEDHGTVGHQAILNAFKILHSR